MYFTCGSLSLWPILGMEILAHLYVFSLACFRAFRDAPHSQFWCRDLTMLTGLFFGPFPDLHTYFTCGSLSLWTMPGSKILVH